MPQDIVDKFSNHLKNVLTRALCFVVETDDKTIQPEHLLWALGTQKGCIGAEILKKAGVKPSQLKKIVGVTKTANNLPAVSDMTLNLSDDAKRIVEKAVLTANVYGHRYVGTEHLLSGMMQAESPRIMSFFTMHKTDLKELRSQLSIVLKSTSKFPDLANTITPDGADLVTKATEAQAEEPAEKKLTALNYFSRELTAPEVQENIDPVIGRADEISRVMEILCRRTKNNPLLLGEPGVGKTAIVEGLAKMIVEGTVPPVLAHKRIFAVDMALLIAGTMYRGEFEGRLRQIIDEVKKDDDIVLFIDEIHTIVGTGAASGSMDAANILKPALARGEIRCIGATTPAEFKKHIEADSALERRFQSVFVDEPSVEKALEILQGVAPYYERFHNVRISHEAIEQAVKMSERYIQDKQLPDKAIDLIDEAAAAVRIRNENPTPHFVQKQLKTSLDQVREDKRQAVVEERFGDAMHLKEEEERMSAEMEAGSFHSSLTPIETITADQVAGVVSRITGIPVSDLLLEGQSALLTLGPSLMQRVMGQDDVLSVVTGALKRAKTGVAHPHRPLASFLFLGPSGVGKTELAKTIAETLFHNKKNLIRLDMSEYSEGFTMTKLIGAPAGYVGYKESAGLTDRVKQRPYSVILFDEIEKAHRDVQNLLLQIFEEGELTDATGRKVNFKNTIIILTSNVGLERFGKGSFGFMSSDNERTVVLNQDLRKELEERFRPELVNRIDHTCIFQPLKKATLHAICKKQLSELTARLKNQGLHLKIHKDLAPHITSLADPNYGARTIRQHIQKEIEHKIAERLTKKDRPKRLNIRLKNKRVVVTKTKT
ncbi:ATP-dependent Clp protease ATP-binding subunit [Candidatus Uhrbacteria bacterium]|nr:ATP-dependent Clp protease ATP-binding subunit [Candidatus Uhrbacteria bacterium]